MPQTINQNLTIPANVVTGGIVQAGDVTTLYNSLNAFSVPDSIAALFQSAYSTDVGLTITAPASSTASAADVTISVPAAKVLINLGSFSWASTSGPGTLVFRANASTQMGSTQGAYVLTPNIATSTGGNGVFCLIHGPHDATYTNPVVGWIALSTGNAFTLSSTGSLPVGAWTNIGIGFGTNTSTGTLTVGYQRVFRMT